MAIKKIQGEERLYYDSVNKTVYEQQENGDLNPTATNGAGHTLPVGGIIIDELGVPRTVNRTLVNASASGDTEAVAAQGAGIRIRVVALYAVSSGAVTTKFKSAGTDISPAAAFAANGGMVLPRNDHGWFQTAPNEVLNVNLNGAIATGFMIDWIQTQ